MKQVFAGFCSLVAICAGSVCHAQFPHHPHPGGGHHVVNCGAMDVHNETHNTVHFDVYDSHNREIISYDIRPHQQLHWNVYVCPNARVELNDSGHSHTIGELAREGNATWDHHGREWHIDINHLF